MKKILFILPVAAIGFTGCVVYQPSPTSGQYGYTYDYQVPIAEGMPASTYSKIPEPRKTSFVTAPVVADVPPSPPPTTPPIVSSIPEMTPRPIIQGTTTTVYPQSTTIREGAGAEINAQRTVAGQQPAGAGPSSVAVVDGGLPVLVGGTNNVPTNDVPTNDVPTNNVPTNNTPTNQVPNNSFRPGETNVNEPAGAQPTNNVPGQLNPAPRLPQQPRIQGGQDPASTAPTSGATAPSAGTQDVQGQGGATTPSAAIQEPTQTAPAPAPAPRQTHSFGPAAAPSAGAQQSSGTQQTPSANTAGQTP